MALLMAEKLTPCAAAWSRLMSTRNCGASSRPLGRTPETTLLCAVMPSNWLRAASKASWPWLLRSCSRRLKPALTPSSGMGGGLSEKMKASLTPESAPMARPATASAPCSAPLRSSHGLSETNDSAAFCPWPENEKPITATMLATSGCLSR